MAEMTFLLIVSYSIIVCIAIGFILFAVETKTLIVGLKNEVEGLRKDVQETQALFRNEIAGLIQGFKKLQ